MQHPASRGAVLLCLLLVSAPAQAGAGAASLLALVPEEVRPGGLAVLQLTAPGVFLGVTAGGRTLPVPDAAATRLLVGVDLEAPPGPLPLVVDVEEGGRLRRIQRTLRVLAAHYPVQQLTLPRRFTDLDPATLERVSSEKAILDRLWETATPRQWRGPFRLPLDGDRLASGFGLRRIINAEPRAPHSGVDLAAPAGTPVVAANAGRVALLADQFFSGTSVIIDHGEALFTMYFHLQEGLVRPGDQVARGQPIGRVGSTGRAGGSHLHWGVRLQGARVDPMELLRLTAASE